MNIRNILILVYIWRGMYTASTSAGINPRAPNASAYRETPQPKSSTTKRTHSIPHSKPYGGACECFSLYRKRYKYLCRTLKARRPILQSTVSSCHLSPNYSKPLHSSCQPSHSIPPRMVFSLFFNGFEYITNIISIIKSLSSGVKSGTSTLSSCELK